MEETSRPVPVDRPIYGRRAEAAVDRSVRVASKSVPDFPAGALNGISAKVLP
jgi:hypothetical protein